MVDTLKSHRKETIDPESPRFVHVQALPIKGENKAIYLHCGPDSNPNGAILIGGSGGGTSHQQLLEFAILSEQVDDEADGLGGGEIDLISGTKTRDSAGFGAVEPKILEQIINHLQKVTDR